MQFFDELDEGQHDDFKAEKVGKVTAPGGIRTSNIWRPGMAV